MSEVSITVDVAALESAAASIGMALVPREELAELRAIRTRTLLEGGSAKLEARDFSGYKAMTREDLKREFA